MGAEQGQKAHRATTRGSQEKQKEARCSPGKGGEGLGGESRQTGWDFKTGNLRRGLPVHGYVNWRVVGRIGAMA